MEGHRHHLVSVILLGVLIALPFPAQAKEKHREPFDVASTINVSSRPDAVVVDVSNRRSTGGASRSGYAGRGSACYLREVPASHMSEDMNLTFYRYRMTAAPYYLICGSENHGIVWRTLSITGPGRRAQAVSPREIAMHLRDALPIPQVEVEINPDRGLVGAESWFWLQGYGGAPLSRSTNAFGSSVQVDARVSRYTWRFGDGSSATSSTPGRAYPARSTVRHTYERSSAGFSSGYPVEVDFEFVVRYRIGDGGWVGIPGISRTARADYFVRESQAVIQD